MTYMTSHTSEMLAG